MSSAPIFLEEIEWESVEAWVDQVTAQLDILDPENAIEAQRIEQIVAALQAWIIRLERQGCLRSHLSIVR